MGGFFGGSSQSNRTPFTQGPGSIAGTPLGSMMPGAVSAINSLTSGTALTSGVNSITKQSQMLLTTGTQLEKSAFAGSGMAQSSDLMRGIGQMVQQSNINLAATLAPYILQGMQSGISDVLNAASGTGYTQQFGWNAGASLSTSFGGTTISGARG